MKLFVSFLAVLVLAPAALACDGPVRNRGVLSVLTAPARAVVRVVRPKDRVVVVAVPVRPAARVTTTTTTRTTQSSSWVPLLPVPTPMPPPQAKGAAGCPDGKCPLVKPK